MQRIATLQRPCGGGHVERLQTQHMKAAYHPESDMIHSFMVIGGCKVISDFAVGPNKLTARPDRVGFVAGSKAQHCMHVCAGLPHVQHGQLKLACCGAVPLQ